MLACSTACVPLERSRTASLAVSVRLPQGILELVQLPGQFIMTAAYRSSLLK